MYNIEREGEREGGEGGGGGGEKERKRDDKVCNITMSSNVLTKNINIESLDIVNIKRETYYKMKFIMNCLDSNMAIKKRKTIFYLKNLEDSTTEIITEDYLNKRIIHKNV
jgi:hypothetical protein